MPSCRVESNSAISRDQLWHAQNWTMHVSVLERELVPGAIILEMADINFSIIWDELAIRTLVLQSAALSIAFTNFVIGELFATIGDVGF